MDQPRAKGERRKRVLALPAIAGPRVPHFFLLLLPVHLHCVPRWVGKQLAAASATHKARVPGLSPQPWLSFEIVLL